MSLILWIVVDSQQGLIGVGKAFPLYKEDSESEENTVTIPLLSPCTAVLVSFSLPAVTSCTL